MKVAFSVLYAFKDVLRVISIILMESLILAAGLTNRRRAVICLGNIGFTDLGIEKRLTSRCLVARLKLLATQISTP